MADRKISDLTALTTPASGDYLPIVDISESAAASKNKRVTVQSLFQGIPVNVGIGTSSPQSLLNLSTPSTGTSTESLRIEGGQRSSDSFATGFRVYTESTASDSNRHLRIVCNGSTGFSIQPYETSTSNAAVDRNLFLCPAGGRVGIGTSSPAHALQVKSGGLSGTLSLSGGSEVTGGESSILMGNNDSVGTTGPYVIKSSNRNLMFGVGNSFTASSGGAFTEYLRIDGSGRVGIGTSSPGYLLDVNGSVKITTSGGNESYFGFGANYDNYFTSGVSGAHIFRTPNIERLRIDSSGNVGIGTSSPTALLDVNADTVRVRTARTPASATATGDAGEICWDANYIYVCTATNTWKRAALSTW